MNNIRKEWRAVAKCRWTTAYCHLLSGLEASARTAMTFAEEAEHHADTGADLQAPQNEVDAGHAIPLHISAERKAYVIRKLS